MRPSPGGRGVLVVDDEPALCALLRELFEGEGLDCRTARSGTEGLARLAESRPDLIVLDLTLPDMDGRGFRAEQRCRGFGDVPVLVLTAMPRAAAHAAPLGAPVLTKPFDLGELLATVHRLLGPGAR